MSDIRKKYNDVKNKKNEIINKILVLYNNPIVEEFVSLSKERDKLIEIENRLYEEIKFDEYANCKHILINSKVERDGKTMCFKGCVKCGLNVGVLNNSTNYLSFKNDVMYHYLIFNNCDFDGKALDIVCDIDLAHKIYKRIKEVHPNIDDETAIKYFEIALDNMINIPVNEKRKESRIKRLSLDNYLM